MVELNAKSLGEQIADILAQDIMAGRLSEGVKLGEVELAARFGTSRSPVRDALKILAREHFVEISPRRQVTVQAFNIDSIANIYLIRSRLYGLAAAQHAMFGAAEDHAVLLASGSAMLDAAEVDDRDAFGEANLIFHHLLTSTCGNPVLENAIAGLGEFAVSYLQGRVRAVPGRLLEAAQGHLRTAEAIRDRDPVAAEKAMKGVITGAGRAMITTEAPERAELLAMLELE